MAPVLPRTKLGTLEFFETRLPVWGEAPAAIGLRPLDVTQLTALTEAARAAHDEAERLRAQAKAATEAANIAARALREKGAGMVAVIKAHAEHKNDPNIYASAQINPPTPATQRAPLGAPGKPVLARPVLNPDGSVTLRWSARHAKPSTGAYFVVVREIGGALAPEIIGDAPGRSFTDRTLPRGAHSATYMIIPKRGSYAGDASARVTVQFGVDGLSEGAGAMRLAREVA